MTSNQGGAGFGGDLSSTIHLGSATTNTPRFGGISSTPWTAGYSQGTTVITLGSAAGLVAGPVGTGSVIMLDQLNDASDGFPATGDLFICESGPPTCSNQGGNAQGRTGRAQIQGVTVTAINGNQVTIFPALAMPNWRSSQTPGAWWTSARPLGNAGIENLTVDFTIGGSQSIGVRMDNCANCWITGVRFITTVSGSNATSKHLYVWASVNSTVRSNYFWGKQSDAGFPIDNYAYTDVVAHSLLVENNIFHHNVISLVPNDPGTRNVYAYNYVDDGYTFGSSFQYHSGVVVMALLEGNNWKTALADIIHGVHYMNTHFRNHHDGLAHNRPGTTNMALPLHSRNRFFNIIGNVFGHSSWTHYQTLLGAIPNDPQAIYLLGWQGNASPSPVSNDQRVIDTLMRWGNWDNVTSTNDTGTNDASGTRFCGSAPLPLNCGGTSEVPSGIANFPNSVPASQALPASFYLSAQPSWWATAFGKPPFPAIGPDVVNGDAPNTATTPHGGHANKIPARLCFENTGNDPAYSGSSPPVKLFNAAACYLASAAGGAPGPPTGIAVTGVNGAGRTAILTGTSASGRVSKMVDRTAELRDGRLPDGRARSARHFCCCLDPLLLSLQEGVAHFVR